MFAPEILVADSAEELLEGSGYEDRKLYEAKLVAERIRKLMTEQKVTDKATGELRTVRYSDIVILLRSLSGYADSYAAVLNEAGIPAHTCLLYTSPEPAASGDAAACRPRHRVAFHGYPGGFLPQQRLSLIHISMCIHDRP